MLDLEEKLRLGLTVVEGGGGGDVDVFGARRGEEAAGERGRKKGMLVGEGGGVQIE